MSPVSNSLFAADPPVIAEGLFSYELGGSERVGADLALECSRRGYRVVCFAFYGSDGPIRRELESASIECFDMNYLRRTRFVRRVTHHLALAQLFRREKVRVAHIHHCTSLILGARAARAAGVPRIVLTEHSILELQTRPSYRAQSGNACRIADAITVVHPSLEDFFLRSLTVPREKLHYIANGVRLQIPDSGRRSALRHDLGVRSQEFLWMFAGRLAAVKDLGTLVRAFAVARRQTDQPLRLVLVGSGAEQRMLEELVRSLALADVVSFLGPRMDVPSLLVAADGFVMSSISEGLPMVLLEAMAARVPCVATAVGGIPALFAAGTGILAPAGSPDALAKAMCAVADNKSRREQIAEAGFQHVKAVHDLERVVDRYLSVFGLPLRWGFDGAERS